MRHGVTDLQAHSVRVKQQLSLQLLQFHLDLLLHLPQFLGLKGVQPRGPSKYAISTYYESTSVSKFILT